MGDKVFIITKITNKFGADDPDKQDWVGIIVKIDHTLYLGMAVFMNCLYPGFGNSILTTRLRTWNEYPGGIRIVTMDCIYWLEEINNKKLEEIKRTANE